MHLRAFFIPVTLLTVMLAAPLWAATPPEYQNCVLKLVTPAKSAFAADQLQEACRRRFLPAKGAQAEESDELDTCLMRHLPAVANDHAARRMVDFCREMAGDPSSAPSAKPQRGMLEWLQAIDTPTASKNQQNAAPWLDGDRFVPLAPAKTGQ
ncbi:MAG: hypothetical protein HQL96_06875 [Magnetococcales bacterium]|nr:hypothetical protein [Magnetococcales bacterium]